MNLTALSRTSETTKYDENATPQDVAVESQQLTMGPVLAPKKKPTISLLRDAMDAFNIRGTARLVSYELLSYWEPGGRVFPLVKTIADRIGKSERVVQRQLEHLERVGVWVRCGPAPVGVKGKQPSLYEMRLPKSSGVTWASPHGVTPTSPRSNQREVVRTPLPPLRGARRKLNGPKPRGGMPDYTERPPRADVPMTAQQTADAEDLAVANGWRKVEGSWQKRR